ncbi:hypothetical protein [Pararhizobium sp.]|uniref:hypothetical protein n=1 Tax=Pararhizobium sp. TaxID=1977563 RepID=UPI0027244F3D|nr:hypothetical protein [Pararhizobium sp.]MDO9418552.1 hypothetical protein [Pararhizobium sp.]
MRRLLKLLKWTVLALVLVVLLLLSPVAYVETMCHEEVQPETYKPLITDAGFRRQEANTYLTYPEWHIVYAYDGLAEALKTGDEKDFGYVSSVAGFWQTTCSLTRMADRHGGADSATRTMVHTIGVSFTLEMALKAAYEETIGRVTALIRGSEKTPQDKVAAEMAADYAEFLRQTPWYKFDFDAETQKLWAAPVDDVVRGWERRLALGGEWSAKTAYAGVIADAVAATAPAKLEIRSVISGLGSADLAAIPNVKVISERPEGIEIETPRYDLFTRILVTIAERGGSIREIAGNDDIMVTITLPSAETYAGPGEVISRLKRDGFASDRALLAMKVTDLSGFLQLMPLADPGLEHVFDY